MQSIDATLGVRHNADVRLLIRFAMDALVEPLIQYGYWILLAWVLLDQLALPVPALPMVLAACRRV